MFINLVIHVTTKKIKIKLRDEETKKEILKKTQWLKKKNYILT
jgi:hypothetical protein